MRKSVVLHVLLIMTVVALAGLFAGCAKQAPQEKPLYPAFEAQDLGPMLKSGGMGRKIYNMYFIMDASQSMSKSFKGKNIPYTKELFNRMMQTIPSQMEEDEVLTFTTTFRTFGHAPDVSHLRTKTWYGPSYYSASGLRSALDNITRAGGRSPLHAAIDAAAMDLKNMENPTSLVIFTDGEFMGPAEIESAQRIYNEFGDKVCIFVVQIGDHAPATMNMKRIADAAPCGSYLNGEDLMLGGGMADFVKEALLGPDSDGDGVADSIDQCPDTPTIAKVDRNGCPLDSDGDGVPDYLDQCPDTPQGVEVDKWGCPADSDGDGVPDNLDKCPNTPAGAEVDADGCWILGEALFDFAKFEIKAEAMADLDKVADILIKNPQTSVVLKGHTDNIGSEEFNMGLSKRRAMAVKDYLVGKGVPADQLGAEWFGFSRPRASNDTEEGRMLNRRTEITPVKQ